MAANYKINTQNFTICEVVKGGNTIRWYQPNDYAKIVMTKTEGVFYKIELYTRHWLNRRLILEETLQNVVPFEGLEIDTNLGLANTNPLWPR